MTICEDLEAVLSQLEGDSPDSSVEHSLGVLLDQLSPFQNALKTCSTEGASFTEVEETFLAFMMRFPLVSGEGATFEGNLQSAHAALLESEEAIDVDSEASLNTHLDHLARLLRLCLREEAMPEAAQIVGEVQGYLFDRSHLMGEDSYACRYVKAEEQDREIGSNRAGRLVVAQEFFGWEELAGLILPTANMTTWAAVLSSPDRFLHGNAPKDMNPVVWTYCKSGGKLFPPYTPLRVERD